MVNLTRYNAANLDQLMDRITRNTIGMDEYFDRIFKLQESSSNYPPYNLIQISDTAVSYTHLTLPTILLV